MSKDTSMALTKLKNSFIRQPHPQMFSRIVSVLLTYVDRDTLKAWPSQKRLAGQVGCNEKTVKRNLEAARNLGLLTIESVSGEELKLRTSSKKKLPPHHRFTIYTIHMDHPLWKGDGEAVREAKQLIKQSTHKGVDERCDRHRRTAEVAKPVNHRIPKLDLDVPVRSVLDVTVS